MQMRFKSCGRREHFRLAFRHKLAFRLVPHTKLSHDFRGLGIVIWTNGHFGICEYELFLLNVLICLSQKKENHAGLDDMNNTIQCCNYILHRRRNVHPVSQNSSPCIWVYDRFLSSYIWSNIFSLAHFVFECGWSLIYLGFGDHTSNKMRYFWRLVSINALYALGSFSSAQYSLLTVSRTLLFR